MAGPIIGQNPNDLTALNIFSASAAFTGQFQLAENFLKRGLAIDASHAELNNNLKINLSLELGDKFLEEKFIEIQKK